MSLFFPEYIFGKPSIVLGSLSVLPKKSVDRNRTMRTKYNKNTKIKGI